MPNGNLDTEKYKQELMRLYSRSTSAEEKQVTQPVPEEIKDTDTEAPDDTVYAEHTEEDSNGAEEDYNSRFPEPDLSELDTDFGTHSTEDDVPPVYDSDELLGTERGYILVNVRTGDDSSAVAGAFISVTAIVDGKRLVLASGVTDESGVSPKLQPHTPASYDGQLRRDRYLLQRGAKLRRRKGVTHAYRYALYPRDYHRSPRLPRLRGAGCDGGLCLIRQERGFQ